MSQNIKFGTCEPLADQTRTSVADGIDDITKLTSMGGCLQY